MFVRTASERDLAAIRALLIGTWHAMSGATHGAFYDATKTGDTERAVAQLSGHYRRVASLIRRHIKEADARARGETTRRRVF